MSLHIFFALFTAALSVTVSGQITYRCVDSSGKITFTDNDCAGARTAIKVQPNSIGDGGALTAKTHQATTEKVNALDLAVRRYREVNDRVQNLRAALDNNESSKRAEVQGLLAEKERCRFHQIPTRRCNELDAMKQSDIDDKYHTAWMRDHRAWTAALSERIEAGKSIYSLGGKPPQ